MKRVSIFLLNMFLLLGFVGCAPNISSGERKQAPNATNAPESKPNAAPDKTEENEGGTKHMLYIKVGDSVLEAELEDNTSAAALIDLLQESDITLQMSDYGHFEKAGPLGTTLPANDEPLTTKAGDLILYQGNQFVIYYDTNAWNLTKLGTIKDKSQAELRSILGDGDVTVTLTVQK